MLSEEVLYNIDDRIQYPIQRLTIANSYVGVTGASCAFWPGVGGWFWCHDQMMFFVTPATELISFIVMKPVMSLWHIYYWCCTPSLSLITSAFQVTLNVMIKLVVYNYD